jgi:hypothetical protein
VSGPFTVAAEETKLTLADAVASGGAAFAYRV